MKIFQGRFIATKQAWLNLWRHRRRTLLSILVIGVAVFSLVSTGGFGLYTYQSLEEMATRSDGHLILSTPNYFESDEELPLSNGLIDYQSIKAALEPKPKVKAVLPRIDFTGLISNGIKSTIFIGMGIEAKSFAIKGPFLNVKSGKLLGRNIVDSSEPQVMLASGLARNLQLAVGDWVTLLATTSDGVLNAYYFKVQGIYSTGVPELDKRELYIHMPMAQSLLASNKVSTLSVFLFDTPETDRFIPIISDEINHLSLSQDVEITPWYKRAFYYDKVRDLYDRLFFIMGAVLALVVFIALFNTLIMSVTERTREIGTLAALGTSTQEIVGGFMREAGLMGILGSIAGCILSAALSLFLFIIPVEMPPPPGSTEGYPLYIYFSWQLAVIAGLCVLFICLMSALLAAYKGARRPITEALGYV